MSAPAAASASIDDEASSSSSSSSQVPLPPVTIAIRSRLGIEFRSAPFSSLSATKGADAQFIGSEAGAEGQIIYSPDGKRIAIVTQKNVQIVDSKSMQIINTINRGRIEHLWWSPLSGYFATWERKTLQNKSLENVFVFSATEGSTELLKIHWNDLDAAQQRPLQWTWDENILALLSTNEIKFLSAAKPNLSTPITKLYVKEVVQFALAPAVKPYQVAVFLPSKGTDPARVNIYTYPHFGAPAAAVAAAAASASNESLVHTPQASKSFFKAEEVELKWSPTGTAILIETRTSTDKTGKSYYGESGLHLLQADGSYQGTVPFGTNPGPIQDVEWSPTGKEFLVIQGFQPAKSTLFVASNCTPIREYGTGSRNTIRWSPHGRFVVLGGFGNLAGELEFWDNFKFKKMGTAIDRDGAKHFSWTPDGRYFITASLRPWRRVDNGYKIWTYYGELVYAEKYDELYQCVAQPAPAGIYPNRPQSPRLTDKRKQAAAAAATAGTGASPTAAATTSAAPAKTGAYIPPHLRAQGATAPSSIMKRETDSAPKKLNQSERAAITGEALPEDGGLSKSQVKRAKAKASAQRQREEEERRAESAAAEAALEAAKKNDLNDPAVVARKIKALQKKMRQIVELKEKRDQGGELNEDQQQKIDSEEALNQEMKELTLLAQQE